MEGGMGVMTTVVIPWLVAGSPPAAIGPRE
jgi:hypothetical protein